MVVGIDGCPAGWVAARYDGAFTFQISPHLGDLLSRGTVVVDIPFGLIDTYPRPADVTARRHLARLGKGSSVFPSPIRPVLACSDYREANQLSKDLCGKGLSTQAFYLFSRIREAESLAAEHGLFEGHPELSFAIWSQAKLPRKRTLEGGLTRLELVRSLWPGFVLPSIPGAAADDILDAVALVWTGLRIEAGIARSFPDPPRTAPSGIRSTIYA